MLPLINQSGIEPLFATWEEPNKFRRPNPVAGGAAIIEPGRRASKALLVPRIRAAVDEWRRGDYAGASETTRTLLNHWFRTEHENFRYHFCQREAIETFIWLYEVAKYRDLSSIYSSLWDEEADPTFEKQITPADDAWARGVAKIATGGGKTKVMSLVMVWSYFHKRFEENSDMTTHFVAIAPNLIVFERLKDDFLAKDGRPSIFYTDPLLPPEWKGEWDVPVVLQDEPGGETGAGALYLTNIHRLYDRKKKVVEQGDGGEGITGPTVKRAKALSTGEQLRARIASHPNFLVLNDGRTIYTTPNRLGTRPLLRSISIPRPKATKGFVPSSTSRQRLNCLTARCLSTSFAIFRSAKRWMRASSRPRCWGAPTPLSRTT